MATYYADPKEDGLHEKVHVEIKEGRYGGWSWSVCIDTGEVYDDTSETGTRLKRAGEEVDPKDLVWRVLMHGYARSENDAQDAAKRAALSLSAAFNEIASKLP